MKDILLVSGGGVLGALARLAVSRVVVSQTFPLATLFVNVFGSIGIGFLAERFSGHSLQKEVTLFCIVGFLGAFTTFSTFSYETVTLARNGSFGHAILNIAANLGLCLGGTVLGLWIGSMVKV